MSVKFADKPALPAWCPIASSRGLIALGSYAPAPGHEFSPGSELEILSLDSSARGDNLTSIARTQVDSQFRSIAWADVGPSYQAGVIAGGLVDGTVALWDASKLIGSSQTSSSPARSNNPLIFSSDLHANRAVSCMEFNPQKQSLLGTGGLDGGVQVINIERPSNPDIFRGVTTTKHQNSEVLCLAWNRKVQHILSTASNQGVVVVWDLKSKKEVVSIKDPANRTRCSALSWNPEIATQLLVAYNDDNNPCIQLWDMRNCSYPFREFQEHSRGVTAASFCDQDPSLLVSSGRDNRAVCWSLHSGQLEAYSDLNLNAPATRLEWSPHMPGFIAAASTAGTVTVHSIAQRQTATAAKYPPKWSKMPCGVSFGFGGKLVTFGSKQQSQIQLHVVPDEPDVANEADKFEQFLASDLRPFCATKADEAQDPHERLTWTLMSYLFEGPSGRQQILTALGFDSTEVQASVERFLGRPVTTAQHQTGKVPAPPDTSFDNSGHFTDGGALDAVQLDNLFDQLARNSEQQQSMGIGSASESRKESPRAGGFEVDDHIPPTDWSQGPEAIIKQSILLGDIESAVDCCMKRGRYADALFLAAGGSAELWKRSRDEYVKKQKDPFIRLMGYVLSSELEKLVQHSDLSSWVETLAILITYASAEAYPRLVEMLGERLEKERFDIRSGVLCYLACGSFANTVRIWASMGNTQGSQTQALQGLVEKMSCLFSAVRPSGSDPIFSHKVEQYATLLANSGRISAAMRCLILVPDSTETKILKDRIYNAAPALMGQLVRTAPAFPFEVSDVRPAPSLLQQKVAGNAHYPGAQGGRQQQGIPAQLPSTPHGFPPAPHGTQPQAFPQRPAQPNTFANPQNLQQAPPVGNPPPRFAPPPQAGSFAHAQQSSIPHTQQQPPSRVSTPGPGPTAHPSVAPPMQTQPANVGYHHQQVSNAAPVRTSTIPTRPGVNAPSHSVGPPVAIPATTPVRPGFAPPSNRNVPTGNPIAPNLPAQAPQSGWEDPSFRAMHPNPPSVQPPQMGPPRQVVGPPNTGGLSTAPHATANPITPGMPVSWPVPTPVQQQLSRPTDPSPNSATAHVMAGDPVPAGDVAAVQRSLGGLLQRCAQDGNRRKWEDTGRKLDELYEKLATGQISRESVVKVKELCACIERGDFASASRLRVELSASDWERNRTWLFAVQLLLPK